MRGRGIGVLRLQGGKPLWLRHPKGEMAHKRREDKP